MEADIADGEDLNEEEILFGEYLPEEETDWIDVPLQTDGVLIEDEDAEGNIDEEEILSDAMGEIEEETAASVRLEEVTGAYSYDLGDGTVEIDLPTGTVIGYTGSSDEIVLPAEVEGVTITGIESRAFADCASLKRIIVPEGYTEIGSYAFSGCRVLEEIVLPESLITLGSYAFYDCDSLTRISIPAGVTVLEAYTFASCDQLKEVVLPEGLEQIGEYVFSEDSSLTKADLPTTVTKIGQYSFSNCQKLESVDLPEGLEELGSYAYQSCYALKEVVIPEKITVLPGGIFSNCSGLESAALPDSLTSIGSDAFYYCRKLKEITLPESLKTLGSYAFRYSGLKEIRIPEGITEIPYECFENSSLEKVILPATLTTVSSYAFRSCSSLSQIYFYGAAPSLSYNALYETSSNLVLYYLNRAAGWTSPTWNGYSTAKFYKDTDRHLATVEVEGGTLQVYTRTGEVVGWEGNLTALTLPAEVNGTAITKIANNLFKGCDTLTKVVIPESYTEIGVGSFSQCSKLTEVSIAGSVRKVGDHAFDSCSALEHVTLGEGTRSLGAYAFYKCPSLQQIAIPDTVSAIGAYAFYECESLQQIAIPDTVSSIGEYAFYNCDQLSSIVVPAGMKTLEAYTFADCDRLTDVTLPEGLRKIGDHVFENDQALSSAPLPSTVTSIGSSAFSNCQNLEKVTLPSALTSLGDSAFASCGKITGIDIPAGIKTLPSGVFRYCAKLSEVTLPDSLTAIGSGAFEGCRALQQLTLPAGLKTLGSQCLRSTGLTELVIPEGVTTIPYEGFEYSSLKTIVLPSTITAIEGYGLNCSGLSAVYFYGHAPTSLGNSWISGASDLTLYYIEGSARWTMPTWNGKKTEIFRTGKGHRYVLCAEAKTWDEARADALDKGGELACISSQDEYDLIKELFTSSDTDSFWIGGSKASAWSWASGEAWQYTAWADGQPGDGDRLAMIPAVGWHAQPADTALPYLMEFADYASVKDAPTETQVEGAQITFDAKAGTLQKVTGEITSFAIPAEIDGVPVTKVKPGCFASCAKLAEITLAEGQEYFLMENGLLYTQSGEELLAAPRAGQDTAVIREGTVRVETRAFSGSQINIVVIPESLEEIGAGSFAGCTALTELRFTGQSRLKKIGEAAFRGCEMLNRISLPDSVQEIGAYAFAECSGLLAVTLPQHVSVLETAVFQYDTSLRSVTIPEQVTKICGSAFGYASALSRVYFEGDAPEVAATAFPAGTQVTIYALEGRYGWTVPTWKQWHSEWYESDRFAGYGFYEVEGGAIRYNRETGEVVGCSGHPVGVILPGQIRGTKITGIGEKAFAGCITLTDIYLPDSLTAISEDVFDGIEELRMYGSASEQWSAYAMAHGYTYGVLSVSNVSPSSSSTIGGAKYTISLRLNQSRKEIPLTLAWIREGQEVQVPAVLTTSYYSYNSYMQYNYQLDLTDVPSGLYTLSISNAQYGIEEQVQYEIDRTAPEAVKDLQITPGDLQNTVSWAESAEADVRYYKVYRAESAQAQYTLLTSIYGRQNTSFVDTGVNENIEYWYKVSAQDDFAQEGQAAGPVGSMPESDITPPQIREVSPVNHSTLQGQQVFSVRAEDNKAVRSITLEYRLSEEEEWITGQKVLTDGVGALVLDTTLIPRESVFVRFTAEDIYGNQAVGQTEYVYTIDNQGPAKVQNLTYTSTSSVITLSWDDVPDDDLQYFSVEEKQSDHSWSEVKRAFTERGVNLTGLAPGYAGTYRVIAYDLYGNAGEPSEELTAETTADTTAPVIAAISPEPRRVQADLTLNFTVSDDVGIRSLQIQTSTDQQKWTDLKKITVDQVSTQTEISYIVNTDDFAEGSLFIRGIAEDTSGNIGDSSAQAPFVEYIVDRTAPEAPAQAEAEILEDYGAIRLRWQQGQEDDLDGYRVLRSDREDGSYTVIADHLRTISYVDQAVERDVTWYYRLQAIDEAGNVSACSPVVSALVPRDKQALQVHSIAPADGYICGRDATISVLISDNDEIDTLYAKYTTDGSTWTRLEDMEILEKSGVYTLDLIPAELNADSVTVEVWCSDRSGNVSPHVSHTYGIDTQAPETPVLTGESSDGVAVLHWTASGEEDLAGFYLYRRASSEQEYTCILQYAAEDTEAYTFTDQSVESKTTYAYYICAVDERGNISEKSDEAVVTVVGEQPDTTDPVAYIQANRVGEVGREIAFSAENSRDDRQIVSYTWDFGDGSASTLIKPKHAYQEAGTYTVTLTVRDGAGNQNETTLTVDIREAGKTGNLLVHVVDENGRPVPEAGVYFNLGRENMNVISTDGSGQVVLTAERGTYPVGAYKDGYLPAKQEVQILENAEQELTLSIEKKDIVVGELKVHRMTLDEIKAAGINVADPANQQVFKFKIKLTYADQQIDLEGEVNQDGEISHDHKTIRFKGRSITFKVLNLWPFGSGGGGGNGGGGGGGSTAQEIEPVIATVEIPGEGSWLKDFFDVELSITNQASAEFVLDNCHAKLNVPDGLTLMESNRTKADPNVSMGSIAGGETKTAEWILRGDTPGEYDGEQLNADFTAVLRDFGAQIQANFKPSEPVRVRGGEHMYLDVVTEDSVAPYTDGAIRVGLRNEDTEPVYLPNLALDGVEFVRKFKTKGTSSYVDSSMDTLEQGEEIWLEYLVKRDIWNNWEELKKENAGKKFYLVDQIVEQLSGVGVNVTYETVPQFTIAADKIEIWEYDAKKQKAVKKLKLLELEKEHLTSARVPDLLIRTFKSQTDGSYKAQPMHVTVVDDYKEDALGAGKGITSFTTDDSGEYVLNGYEITNWFKDLTDEEDSTRTNFRTYDIHFYASRAVGTLSVVARGATYKKGILKVNVMTALPDGKVKRLKDVTVTAGGYQDTTDKQGYCDIKPIPQGKTTVKVRKKGYLPLEKSVSIGDVTEETFFLEKDDGTGRSHITGISNDLSSNNVGNVTILPESTATNGEITFTLTRDMVEGEAFRHYTLIRVEKDGKEHTTDFFDNVVKVDAEELHEGDRFYFTMTVADQDDIPYTTPRKDSLFWVVAKPKGLSSLVFNMSRSKKENDTWYFPDKAQITLEFLKYLKKDKESIPLTYFLHLENGSLSSEDKENTYRVFDEFSVAVEQKKKFDFDVSYDPKGKITFKIIFGKSSQRKNTWSAYLNSNAGEEELFSSTVDGSGKISSTGGITLVMAYNKVTNTWDYTLSGNQKASYTTPEVGKKSGLWYATFSAEGGEEFEVQILKGTLGDAGLDALTHDLDVTKFALNMEAKLSGGGALGNKRIASAGLYVKVGGDLYFLPTQKIDATCKVGYEGNVLIFKKSGDFIDEKFELASLNWERKEEESEETADASIRKMADEAEKNAGDTYTVDAPSEDSQWIGSEDMLAADIYYDASPQLMSLPDGRTMMAFAGYRADSSDPVGLYYTIQDQGSWSTPKEIDPEGKVGLYPSLSTLSDGTIRVTWMQLTDSLDTSAAYTYEELVEKLYGTMSVCQAEYQIDTDSWTTQTQVAADHHIVMKPQQSANGESEMKLWISNRDNRDEASEDHPDVIMWQLVQNGEITDSGSLDMPEYRIKDVRIVPQEKDYLLYVQTGAQTGSGKTYMMRYHHGKWSGAIAVGNTAEDMSALTVAAGSAYTVSEGRIMKAEGGRMRQVLASHALDHVDNLSSVTLADGTIVMTWAQSENDAGIYVSASQDTIHFSDPIRVVTSQNICTEPTIAVSGDGCVIVYKETSFDIVQDKKSIVHNMKSIKLANAADILVVSEETSGYIFAGKTMRTTYQLRSKGILPVNEADLVISYDPEGTDVIAKKEQASMSGTMVWTVPKDYRGQSCYLVVRPRETDDQDLSDNAMRIDAEYNDLSLTQADYFGQDKQGSYLRIRIENNGLADSQDYELVITDNASKQVLHQETGESLAAGTSRDITVIVPREKGMDSLTVEIRSHLNERELANNKQLILITAEMQFVSEEETETESETEKETETESETKPGKETETESETKPGKETEAESETKPGKETEAESETKPGKETEAESETKPGKETETGTGAETRGETETEKPAAHLHAYIKMNVKAGSTLPMKTKQKTSAIKVTELAAGDYITGWASSNEKAAKVKAKGNTATITAGKKTGTTVITVKSAAGAVYTFKIKVQKKKVTSKKITVISKKITMNRGEKLDLSAVVTPITSQDKVSYTSSAKKIVTVTKKGVIQGKKKGKATITVKSGSKKVKINVTVK